MARNREPIDTGTDKRGGRRDGRGTFKQSDHVGRSLEGNQRNNHTPEAIGATTPAPVKKKPPKHKRAAAKKRWGKRA
jgi:hypothetical protein